MVLILLPVGLHLWAWSQPNDCLFLAAIKMSRISVNWKFDICPCNYKLLCNYSIISHRPKIWGGMKGPVFRMKQSWVLFSWSLYYKFQCLKKLCYRVRASQFLCILIRYWCWTRSLNLYRNSENCPIMRKHSCAISLSNQPYGFLVALKGRVNPDSIVFGFSPVFLC